jgi:hypothetical protein
LKKWTVTFHDEFEPEFDELPAEVQDELFAAARPESAKRSFTRH